MIVALLLPVALALSPGDVTNPQADHRGWVSDLAQLLDPAAERAMEQRLADLHRDIGVEVALVTVQNVDRSPKAFVGRLFNDWEVGDRDANNGLVVLMAMDERRLEMETGYGLEAVLPDSWLGSMQKTWMVPLFKEQRYAEGLVVGMAQVDTRIREHAEEARAGTRGMTAAQRVAAGDPTARLALGALGAAGGGILGVGFLLFRRRQRTCPDCRVFMPMLSEVDDDAHLEEGEQLEESLGSVDYQVHQCPRCDFVRTFNLNRWFSGYSSCPSCQHRTRSTKTTLLHAATQYSTGLARITEDCVNCSYHHTYTHTIPRLSPPSSSGGSASGGGSFGGGSSGGGGAGSSW